MRNTSKAAMAAALVAMASTSACTTNAEGEQRVSRAAIGGVAGAVGGFFLGDLVGGRQDRTEKIVGAGIGALAGAGIGAYMDEQERKLRRQTEGTDIDVIRDGDQLLLNMPSGVTFATNSFTIQPQFQRTLDQVASTLAEYDQTYIDVLGHTDSTGNDSINEPLSRNRAQSVASYLASRGVLQARIGTQGFSDDRPIADNDTIEGRQANRRVEIKIVPVTEDDVRAAG